MPKDITQYVGRKSHEQDLLTRFEKLVKTAKSKKEIRELEMRLLKPKPISHQYKGPRPGLQKYKRKVMKVTFPSSKYIDQWAKHFKVNSYIENNTYDVQFLIRLFQLMNSGEVKWDSEIKDFCFHGEKNEYESSSKKKKRKITRRNK